MKSADRGPSTEAILGTAIAFVILLINPEETIWRIVILVAAGLLFLFAVGKSEWVKQTDPILTLNGESIADEHDTFWRKLKAYGLVIVGITLLGFVTWPIKPVDGTGDEVILTSPVEAPIQFHTPKGIEPEVQSQAEAKQVSGRVLGVPGKGIKQPVVRPNPPTGMTILSVQ